MKEKTKSKKQYARVFFKSAPLGHVLENLRKRYEAEQKPEFLVVPYTLTCAAYLEAKLNDSLSQFAAKRYGEDTSNALLSLSLPKKLNVLVPVLTEGAYQINKAHFIYLRLASLISIRNSIAHAKPEMEKIDAADEDLVDFPILFSKPTKMPRQFQSWGTDITLGAAKTFTPTEYHEVLDKLEKWFFHRCPDKLNKVAMVEPRSKNGQWEEAATFWIKYL